jgi:hypothetical protein
MENYFPGGALKNITLFQIVAEKKLNCEHFLLVPQFKTVKWRIQCTYEGTPTVLSI